jgi:hypothetical protein
MPAVPVTPGPGGLPPSGHGSVAFGGMPAPLAPLTDDVDELMRRPPLYSQQNSPLDAPRFTRSARPAQPPAAPQLRSAPATFGALPPAGSQDQTGAFAPPGLPAPQSDSHTMPAPQAAAASRPTHTAPGQPDSLPPLPAPGMGGQGPAAQPTGAAPAPGATRSPLQAPDMGQHNAPRPAQAPDSAPPRPLQAPDMGQHNAVPQAATRSPLQAPDMGQHNAPLPPSAGQAPEAGRSDGAPSDEQNAPSGLPSRGGTGVARPAPSNAPEVLDDPSKAPSGLPGRRPQQ